MGPSSPRLEWVADQREHHLRVKDPRASAQVDASKVECGRTGVADQSAPIVVDRNLTTLTQATLKLHATNLRHMAERGVVENREDL